MTTLEPKDLIHQYLEAHSIDAGISITELLADDSFRASYSAVIEQLAFCHYEIVERGIVAARVGE